MNPLDQVLLGWAAVFLLINVTFFIARTINNAGIIDVFIEILKHVLLRSSIKTNNNHCC